MSDQEAYLPRHLEAELNEALGTARVVNLIGPRQAGKTTLVRDLFKGGQYLTLDDAATLNAIEADPSGQLESLRAGNGGLPIITDEAQR